MPEAGGDGKPGRGMLTPDPKLLQAEREVRRFIGRCQAPQECVRAVLVGVPFVI